MTQLPYKVFDADNHYYEPKDAFLRHLPKHLKDVFKYVQVDGRDRIAINGLISDTIPNPTFTHVASPGAFDEFQRGDNPDGKSLRELIGDRVETTPAAWQFDRAARVKQLEDQNVQSCLLFPTLASVIEERITDPRVGHGLMHSLNEWIHDEWGFDRDGRIYGVPVITLMDCEEAVKELDLLLSRGARTVLLRPYPPMGLRGLRSFALEEFDPFWARINESGIPVSIHSSDMGSYDRSQLWENGDEFRAFDYTPFKIVSNRYGAICDSVAALICHGVFDRHPGVKIALIENGAGWVPGLIKSFEKAYAQMPQGFSIDPTDRFRESFWISPFYEDNFDDLRNYMPVEHILFGSDFPHPEGLAEPLKMMEELRNFTEDETEKVMGGNIRSLLKLAA